MADEEKQIIKPFCFLTIKPIIYLANVSEDNYNDENPYFNQVYDYAIKEGSKTIKISAKLECDLVDYTDDEKEMLKSPNGISIINETMKEILQEYCRVKKEMYYKKCETLIRTAGIVGNYVNDFLQESQTLKDCEESLQKEFNIPPHGVMMK